MNSLKKYKSKIFYASIGIIILSIILGGLFSPFIIKNSFLGEGPYTHYKDLGPVGDWIGGSSTPFFTFASLLILVATFAAQMAELREARREFKKQNRIISNQKFDDTFFNLLHMFHEITNSISTITIRTDNQQERPRKGKECFYAFYEELKKILDNDQTKIDLNNLKHVEEAYEKVYEIYEDKLGHYFRTLYRIYKFLDGNNDISDEEKNNYSDLIRAQLSKYEEILLLYNILSGHGKKFLYYAKKYDILEGLMENNKALKHKEHLIIYLGIYSEEINS